MAVILRDVPGGYNWGWFSREDSRMHLQTVDDVHRNLYKVWLEKKGTRLFEAAGPVPAKVLKKLQAEVARLRRHLEGRWASFMITNRWLELNVALPEAALTAYPGTTHRFTRKVNLQDWFSPEAYAKIRPADVFLNEEMGALSIFRDVPEDRRHDFDLSPILWRD
jgi:hypothetical protein